MASTNKSWTSLLCLLATLFALSGCASLPEREDLTLETEQHVRQAFKTMVDGQQQCACCLDAAADMELKSMLFSRRLKGYLQAMSPSFIKFVAINPLGQPMGILTCDGRQFRYVDVMGSTAYDGNVEGKTFADYAPPGFVPAFSFYWLIGRLQPGPARIIRLSQDKESADYWVELRTENRQKSLLLFSPQQGIIRRHIVLDNEDEQLLNILYDDYGSGPCPLPGKITITSLRLGSTLELTLSDFRADVTFKQQDFSNPAPASFLLKSVE